MKKNKNRKIKVNAYYNGMDTINNIAGATGVVGSALSGVSDEGSNVNTAGNVLASAGSFAAAGSAFGPIGTGVGAALGAVVGGITSARKKRQLINKRIRDNYIKSTEVGMNQTAAAAEEYWNNNNAAYSFENGGILPDLAYVDNNEILRDDNGDITKVPNNMPGTDNHLIDSSSLDSVLSDNIKRPGTKNTFAKEGEKLVKRMKPSKGKDKFAENTNRLNKLNANKAYEALLAEQEQVKAKKGIKPKTKSLISAYLDGTGSKDKAKEELDINAILSQAADYHNALALQKNNKESNRNDVDGMTYEAKSVNPSSNYKVYPSQFKLTVGNVTPEVDYSIDHIINADISKIAASAKANTTTTRSNNNNTVTEPNNSNVSNVPKQFNPFLKELKPKSLTTKPNYPTSYLEADDSIDPTINTGTSKVKTPAAKPSKKVATKANATTPGSNASKQSIPFDWASLAPVIYNTLQGFKDPEIDPLVTNPYNNQIINSMAKRRMNIDPMLSANARSRAISNYNLANLNANTGANLAARAQAAVNEYAANEALYGAKQNADNAYIADYANTLNNLGQQYASSRITNLDLNAKNRAAVRAFSSKAASQLGEWSQINSKMRNAYNRDMMMWPMLEKFLSQGYTTDELAQLKLYL